MSQEKYFEKIVENVFLFRDCVNVYAIKDGESAILIDFGSGKILDYLSEINVKKVEYILHTHYHRDQCYGDELAIERGISIAAPDKEKKLFEKTDSFWKEKSYYHIYNMKPTFFVSTYRIPLDRTFKDKDSFRWGPYIIDILETKGHTRGSLTYTLKLNGKILAFTGDLIYSHGKILTLYDLVYAHGKEGLVKGILNSTKSLKKLARVSPSLLLTSHGDVISTPEEDIQKLINRLNRILSVFRLNTGIKLKISRFLTLLLSKYPKLISKLIKEDKEITSVFQHIKFKGFGTSYVIIGKNKNCILIDFAAAGAPFWPMDLETLKNFLQENEIETIDFIITTHYHDDHVIGIPLLQKELGTKVYTLQNIKDILENPTHYRLPCLSDKSITVDKTFKEGDVLKWEDYQFNFFHFPGQTEYHLGIFTEIDGKSIFFTGDSFRPNILKETESSLSSYNLCKIGKNVGIMKCAETLVKCNPEYIASSHFGIFKINHDILEKWYNLVGTYEETLTDLIAQENPNFGFDPQWVHFNPIRIITKPGEEVRTNLVVRNYQDKSVLFEYKLDLPDKWSADFVENSILIESQSIEEIPINIQIPQSEKIDRTIISANIIRDNKNLGPFPDLMIDHGYIPSDSWTGWSSKKGVSFLKWLYQISKTSDGFFE